MSTGQEMVRALRIIREIQGITQQQVAGHMKVTQSTVAQLESNEHDPLLTTILRYADAVGVTLEWRFNLKEEEE